MKTWVCLGKHGDLLNLAPLWKRAPRKPRMLDRLIAQGVEEEKKKNAARMAKRKQFPTLPERNAACKSA